MPWYRTSGKLQQPLTELDFLEAMRKARFTQDKHRGFVALLYYTGVRRTEALRATKEQFKLYYNKIYFDVGKRLKHGIETPALIIPLKAPYASEIWKDVEATKPNARVWPYSARTAYNVVRRVLPAYPHYFRLSRITNFFLEGYTIPQVRSWTGLTLKALDHYVGLVDVKRMGESLAK